MTTDPLDTYLVKLREQLTGISNAPGVYLMKGGNGQVLYVGKARNVRKRLASYFAQPERLSPKTAALVKKIDHFETIVTRTEKEALILEANLIKRYRPKYNVTLKDDKRYPSLRLDLKAEYPYLQIVRKIRKDGALYFGPYASAHAVRQTLKFVHKTFKLRKCCSSRFKHQRRSCLNYQIGTCLGPCCQKVKKQTYDQVVKEVILFLKGRTPDLIKALRVKMQSSAHAQDFEQAAVYRDKIHALEKTLERQLSVITDFKDRDVIALASTDDLTIVTILFTRRGFWVGQRHFNFPETMVPDDILLSNLIQQYYGKGHEIPDEILVSSLPEDLELVSDQLYELKGKKVYIHQPKRGEKVNLIKMAFENAEKELQIQTSQIASEKKLLETLQNRLQLKNLPNRIECFDNSNLGGTEPVSGMVVFEKGKALRSGYRKYKIKNVNQPDDYAAMNEILLRRFGKGDQTLPYPDLLMIDGGKGQLNIAAAVLKRLGLFNQFDLIAIAKKDEVKGEREDKIYKVARANPILFGKDRDLLLFLQRIRDEAHRFAISFHRRRRNKRSLHSILNNISGIGPVRRKILLSHFGGIQEIRAASTEQIAALPGMNMMVATNVSAYLNTIDQ